MTQRDSNPYKYSDSNKRYMTYDWYMKKRFGGKIARVPLDIGCTCPNIDGTRGRGGCIYCKSGSRSAVGDTLEEQYARGVEVASRKWTPIGFVPYLQSNTNTYGEVAYLAEMYERAASMEGAVMLDIATRADCLSDEIVREIVKIAERIPVTVELGLQSTNDSTAERINRGHTFAEFCEGYGRLSAASCDINRRMSESADNGLRFPRVSIGVHLINGLPGESRADMIKSAVDVAELKPELVKLHLMHVLRGTQLAEIYSRGEYTPMEREEYVSVVCDQLEVLPADTVIGRVTGDGVADELLSPQWSRRKTEVANEIDKEMYRRGAYQGLLAKK